MTQSQQWNQFLRSRIWSNWSGKHPLLAFSDCLTYSLLLTLHKLSHNQFFVRYGFEQFFTYQHFYSDFTCIYPTLLPYEPIYSRKCLLPYTGREDPWCLRVLPDNTDTTGIWCEKPLSVHHFHSMINLGIKLPFCAKKCFLNNCP